MKLVLPLILAYIAPSLWLPPPLKLWHIQIVYTGKCSFGTLGEGTLEKVSLDSFIKVQSVPKHGQYDQELGECTHVLVQGMLGL